jgi:glucose-6-phosphate isomerase
MGKDFELEYYPKLKNIQVEEIINIIAERKENWDSPFFVDTKTFINLDKIKSVLNSLNIDNIQNIIILGTGGSIQTLLALKHLSKKKIYPITSSRAVELNLCLESTTPKNSIVIPISRGGETLDINSTIGTFIKKGYNFLGLSSKGTMNKILKRIDCPILDVPDLAGRFAASISNVAIVPAYLAGIDINSFLKGLEMGYGLFMKYDLNPSTEFSAFLFNLYNKGYKIIFSMPYSINLEESIALFVQEISESSGKKERGFMGAYQSAPLCQHSVLEYLLGGTKGIVLPLIWTLERELLDLTLESSIDYIRGQTAHSIVDYQVDATFQALIEQGVPSAKISLETANALNIGQLIAFIQSTVYYICLLLDVNWANNPKVNISKKICNEALLNKNSSQERRDHRNGKAGEVFKSFF